MKKWHKSRTILTQTFCQLALRNLIIYTSNQITKKVKKFTIKLGGDELEEKEFVTYLGVIFDNKLQFNEQFKKVYDKMKSGLNGPIITKNQLNYRAKLAVYHI